MKISFISPFCDLLKEFTSISMLDRANKKGIVEYNFFDLFSFSDDPNNRIDDHPYGGGDGMILKAQPIYSAYEKIVKESSSTARVIYPTPDGEMLSTDIAKDLAKEDFLANALPDITTYNERFEGSTLDDLSDWETEE